MTLWWLLGLDGVGLDRVGLDEIGLGRRVKDRVSISLLSTMLMSIFNEQ